MRRFEQYLDKIGAFYEMKKTGYDYFYNAPALSFDIAYVYFDYSEHDARKLAEQERQIKAYCSRYNYKIYNSGAMPGCYYMWIMKNAEHEQLRIYGDFRDRATFDIETYCHNEYSNGRKPCNDTIKAIMNEHGNYYNEFLAATNAA